MLRDDVDAIVRDSLRPAFDEVLGRVRRLAPPLRGLNLDNAEQMIRSPDAARRAWVELQALVPRWHAILDAHGRLLGLDRESHDYTPIRNVDDVYPNRRAIMGKVAPAPWPPEPMARLLWLATTDGLELWLPTLADERDAYEAAEGARPKMPLVHRTVPGVPRSVVRQDVGPRLSTRRE